jgi:hypothetical protein
MVKCVCMAKQDYHLHMHVQYPPFFIRWCTQQGLEYYVPLPEVFVYCGELVLVRELT